MEINFLPILPAAQVLVTGLAVLIFDLFLKREEKGILVWISVMGLVLAGALASSLWGSQDGAFGDTLRLDSFSLFFTLLFTAAALFTVLSSADYLEDSGISPGEYYSLALFGTFGMIVMASANDLILFFLGLETMSVAVYVLTGIDRSRARSAEAAMKYFVVGSFATGFLLFGIALIFGAVGSTHLGRVASFLSGQGGEPTAMLTAGAFLLLIGLAFKAAAVPFHFWAPDAYEGAPTPITGFMAAAVKASAFAGWARVFLHPLAPFTPGTAEALWVLAVLTMTAGNLLAIAQSSVKRMLAYSSIAHAGYLLIGIAAGGDTGGSAVLFYLCSYGAMTLGAFAVLTALKRGGEEDVRYGDLAGLGWKRPFLAAAMSLFMLSLAGFPPLGGFTGKFYLFRSAILSEQTSLAILGAVNSILSLVYYLRVIVAMYMEEGGMEGKSFARAPYLYAAVAAGALATLYLGVLPGAVLDLSRLAFLSLP
jgi:NADH-quinone oxidoreductase subunit N